MDRDLSFHSVINQREQTSCPALRSVDFVVDTTWKSFMNAHFSCSSPFVLLSRRKHFRHFMRSVQLYNDATFSTQRSSGNRQVRCQYYRHSQFKVPLKGILILPICSHHPGYSQLLDVYIEMKIPVEEWD